MNTRHKRYLDRWLDHVRVLAEDIGPRGSTTEGERQGSEYCEKVLSELGLNPQIETFMSARSIYHPHLIGAIAMLIAFAIYPLAGRWSAGFATILSLATIASTLLELSFRDNLLRRLVPKAPSQNVIATLAPAGEHKQDFVLIGHVDSHRTPIIFKTPRWVTLYQRFTTIAFSLFIAQILLYTLGTVTQWSWIWPASIPCAIAAVLLTAMCIQADLTPFSAGANDNASAVGLVLTLAEEFQDEPIQNSRVWFLCTGCEEVQHYGAIDFFARHLDDLHNPVVIVFEMLSCTGPAWLTKEGIIVPFHADPELVTLAERLSSEHPEWGAYPEQINGGNTEMADTLSVGIPAITLGGIGSMGGMSYWHQVEDTFDKMNREVMSRAYEFVRTYIRTLDTPTKEEE
ncbi:MAG: M28 family peptidase [Anaerolineales bacterium]|nr:M28 family peptidase [Anaerolineales bacterium]